MTTTLSTRPQSKTRQHIQLKDLGKSVVVEAKPTVSDEQRKLLNSHLNKPWTTVRLGVTKTVYLVGVGTRKVTLKRDLDAVDSFQESVEKFLRFYKPS